MTDINICFSQSLLRMGHATVKKHFPSINLRKDVWVWHFHHDHWEFHGPDDYYWNGSAGNAYEARYKGWMAWLAHKGVEV